MSAIHSRAAVIKPPFTLLCRLYEKGLGFVSNSYATRSRFGFAKQITRRDAMSVIPIHLNPQPATRGAKWSGVWQDFAQSLAQSVDALAAYAVRHAVSEQTLRRTDADIRRARELMARRELPRNVNLARLRVRPVGGKVYS
jgi:hypothetical protein